MKVQDGKYSVIPEGVVRHTIVGGTRIDGVRLCHKGLEALVVTSFSEEDGNVRPEHPEFASRSLKFLKANKESAQKLIYPALSHGPGLLDFLSGNDQHHFGRMNFTMVEVWRTFKAADAVVFGKGSAAATMTRDSTVVLFRAGDVVVEAHMPWRGVASVKKDGTGTSTVFLIMDYLLEIYQVDPSEVSMIILPGVRGCCMGFDVNHPSYGENNLRIVNFVQEWNTSFPAVYRSDKDTSFDIPTIVASQAMDRGVPELNILLPEYCTCCGAVEQDGKMVHPFYSHTRARAMGAEYGAPANASNVAGGWGYWPKMRDVTF